MTTFVTASLCWVREARVLTVRKAGGRRFQLPGGKLEPGETARQTAVRETREEVGLVVGLADLVELGTFAAEAANEPGATVVSTVFVVAAGDGRPTPLAEIAEVRWTELDDEGAHLAPLLVREVLPVLRRRARAAAGDGVRSE